MTGRVHLGAQAVIMLTGLLWGGLVYADESASVSQHIADATNPAVVRAGMVQYKTYCAQCHGRNLQGQPLWKVQDAYAHRRAPAQDDTGHTWQHPDEDLFQKIRTGHFPGTDPREAPYMPAFAGVMSDQEILEVMAFIKARWSLGIQIAQASLNPDFAGMPAQAGSVEWTLPLNCSTTAQRGRNESR